MTEYLDRTSPNAAVYAIAKIFREYIVDANSLTSEYSYKAASSKLESLSFTLKDLPLFAGLINGEYFSNKANYWTAGLFISAAINKVIKKNDVIELGFSKLGCPADCIGYKFKQGKIILHGNVGDYLGESMSGGEIIVHDNAGYYVGYSMSGGEIIIHGNAGGHVGRYMSGGIIRINGQIESVSKSDRGNIYHKEHRLR